MTSDRTGSGDPAATLRLLWRGHLPADAPRRGPRRTLDVDTVVSAATTLADDEGLAALTVRRLADRLGTRPMTVYTYVPGRAELLDLMLDAVYAQMPRTSTDGLPWLVRVGAVAEDNRALFGRHPWTAHVSTLRPPLGPGQMAKYEHELAAFTGSGLDDVTTDAALTYLLTFVRAAARDAADGRAAQHAAGDDQQWWDVAGPLLAQLVTPDSYPLASRVGDAAGAAHASAHDPAHAYTFGLDRVLAGLEQLAAATLSSSRTGTRT